MSNPRYINRPQLHSAEERFAWFAQQPLRQVTAPIGFLQGTLSSWHDIYSHRNLWRLLTRREVKARYKDSALGFLWTLIRPIVSLLIYYVAIGKILGAQRSIPDFAIFVFAGLTIWTLFSTAVTGATSSIIGNVGIVKKVYLPRELFPLTAITSAIVDFLSQLVILLVGTLLIRGININQALIWAPLSFLITIVWAIAFGLLLAALNVYLRDTQYLVEVAMMIGFWLTPCVYGFHMLAAQAGQLLMEIYLLNPAALAVMGFQRAFWVSQPENAWPPHMMMRMLIMLAVGLVGIFLAQRFFALLQRNFAQEL